MKNKTIRLLTNFRSLTALIFCPIAIGLLFLLLCIFIKCFQLNFHFSFVPLPFLYWFTYYFSHDEGLHSKVELNIVGKWAFPIIQYLAVDVTKELISMNTR